METTTTVKQRILEMLQRLPDELDYDRAIEAIHLLRRIEAGITESESEEGTEHEEFMRELLAEHEELPGRLDAAG
jgi:hypothetical protein